MYPGQFDLTSGSSVGTNATDMFSVSFNCLINDSTLCNKVQTAFTTAGAIITANLLLNTPINVNATFLNFCASMQDCGDQTRGLLTLGGASPSRTIPMTDKDGVTRLYPQALVKQFPPTNGKKKAFSQFDINAMFNSNGKFWFDGDGPIGDDQSDFLFVIIHELIHGLGFTSSWDDWISPVAQGLTPEIVAQTSNGNDLYFQSFQEYAFDRYMVVLPTLQKTTDLVAQLNTFGARKFVTGAIFMSSLLSSQQGQVAKQMLKYATTPHSLGFMPSSGSTAADAIVLETTLNPYSEGSSVSHVDYATYTNTSDFLMRFQQDRGVSLAQAIKRGGNYVGGAIGPKLKLVLETLGYTTQDNPNPYRPVDTQSNPASKGISSRSSASLFTSTTCLAISILVMLIS